MRHKGLGVCATHNGMQKRRFHFKEVLAVHVATDCGNNLATLDKRALDLGVCNKVNVALTITQLFVGQAVELFRQRTQALRQKLKAARGNGKLTALRAHHGAVHANPVTHVQVLYTLVQILAQVVDLEEQLNVARGVTQTEERALALHALRHNAAGNRNGIFRGLAIGKIGVSRIQVSHMMGVVESMTVRVLARRNQRSALGLANLNGIVFNHLLLCVVLAHRNSPSGKRRRKPDRFCVRLRRNANPNRNLARFARHARPLRCIHSTQRQRSAYSYSAPLSRKSKRRKARCPFMISVRFS